jgi:hypothetical protein
VYLWAKKAKRQSGITGVLLGAYVVLLATLAEGMVRTLLHPNSLRSQWAFFTRHKGIALTHHAPALLLLQREWPPFGLVAYGRFTTM